MSDDSQALTGDEFERWWKETGEYELRQVLYWKWHPIGVTDSFPCTADEYDQYAPQVLTAIRSASMDALATLLRTIERERMGLTGDGIEHQRTVAADVAAWFEQSQARWSEYGPLRR
jgi:hypothetical protein